MILKAAQLISSSKRISVFTGAGISVESGIPPFRGEGGLWSQYNPIILDLDYYLKHTDQSWPVVKKLFFDFFGHANPNEAHLILASWEKKGIIHEIITQNIDNLHQDAGSKIVHEFHGTASSFVCTKCGNIYNRSTIELKNEPPHCKATNCRGLLKPNFIFFGEGIPAKAYEASMIASKKSDLFIVIGTTGEIMPASQIPIIAKKNGAKIIEINISPSTYTDSITDIFIKDKASIALNQLNEQLSKNFS